MSKLTVLLRFLGRFSAIPLSAITYVKQFGLGKIIFALGIMLILFPPIITVFTKGPVEGMVELGERFLAPDAMIYDNVDFIKERVISGVGFQGFELLGAYLRILQGIILIIWFLCALMYLQKIVFSNDSLFGIGPLFWSVLIFVMAEVTVSAIILIIRICITKEIDPNSISTISLILNNLSPLRGVISLIFNINYMIAPIANYLGFAVDIIKPDLPEVNSTLNITGE